LACAGGNARILSAAARKRLRWSALKTIDNSRPIFKDESEVVIHWLAPFGRYGKMLRNRIECVACSPAQSLPHDLAAPLQLVQAAR
jgi:hypothetical protein